MSVAGLAQIVLRLLGLLVFFARTLDGQKSSDHPDVQAFWIASGNADPDGELNPPNGSSRDGGADSPSFGQWCSKPKCSSKLSASCPNLSNSLAGCRSSLTPHHLCQNWAGNCAQNV